MASQRSYEILILANNTHTKCLDQLAITWNKVQRDLYKAMKQNPELDMNLAKRNCIANTSLTGRHFNSIRDDLKGRIASVLELNKDYLKDKISKLKTLTKTNTKTLASIKDIQDDLLVKPLINTDRTKLLKRLTKLQTRLIYISRSIFKTERKLKQLKDDLQNKNARICFGSKKLFKQQFNTLDLKKDNPNQFKDFREWKHAWTHHRSDSFLMIGSKDESFGNVNCQLQPGKKKGYQLQVHVGTARVIIPIELKYGEDYIKQALVNKQALTYRFKKDATTGQYRAWVSMDMVKQAPKIKSHSNIGAIGVDINENHLAVSMIDRFGNLIKTFNIPLNLYGKSSDQATAIIGDGIKAIIKLAEETSRPIVIEQLDFSLKKQTLNDLKNSNKYRRMLSSFSYSKIILLIKARAEDRGIRVIEVNPAYTSMIGDLKYKERFALTVHQAAAMTIARRGIGCKEKALRSKCKHLIYTVPARNQYKQPGAYWKDVFSKKRAHAEQYLRGAGLRTVKGNDFTFGINSSPLVNMSTSSVNPVIKDIFT